jgi:hypothetical protein
MNPVKPTVLLASLLSVLTWWFPAGLAVAAEQQELLVGWAAADITPPKPVALVGQMHKRISQGVLDPLTATVLALETRDDGGAKEQAIMISCDLGYIKRATQDRLKEMVGARLDDFDADKLFLNATHTHTGPQQVDNAFHGLYDVSKDEGVMKASEYIEVFLERVAGAAVEAWQGRKPGGMSWALGQAVVGHNRRAVYFDGHAAMYGGTNRPDFDCLEGYEDHGLEMLFFWTPEKELTGMVINVACPSQETESMSSVSADFWHDVRQEIKKRYSDEIFVYAQCGAAGDQSPHLLIRKQAEGRMLQKRGLSRRQEIARRIADAVDDVFPCAEKEVQTSLVFQHTVVRIDLPNVDPPPQLFYDTDHTKPAELHVLRLGDVAVATNPFELYLDYGVRMKARSKAVLTFVVQLSGQTSGYLPTAKAVAGGGYSADKYIVGPEGGQVLVEETVKRINAMWE